ncbi:fibroblast growth factor receptor-like [Gigantopelta aegis]|uniref:fibroblast growth factor receptor-like n=1 Tax=Gigantopelta aegis TaxID=1735272 RepID=UPI001B888C26|nr:fibroblast growth factor receptor-like [Gigantopelta aegis]
MRLSDITMLLLLLMMLLADIDCRRCKKTKGKKCERRNKGKTSAPKWRRRGPKESHVIQRENSEAVFKCEVVANPRPKYKWYKNGEVLKIRKSKKYRRRRHRLMIRDLTMSDSGNYTCDVYNKLGAVNRTFQLTVLGEKPVISEVNVIERPKNQTAQIGDTVVFLCRTDTWPRPLVEWSRKRNNRRKVEILQKASNRSRSEVLVIHNVTKKEAGIYRCTVHNEISTKQLSAQLVVIAEDEELPFEPKCALHVRQQFLIDSVYGCQTMVPVEITYCMGSCGRSYFVPTLVTTDEASFQANHLNQTCECCVGVVQGIKIVQLDCPSGGRKTGFYTSLRDCICQRCKVEGEIKKKSSRVATTEQP